MNLQSPKRVIVKKDGPVQASFEITKKLTYTVIENGIEIQKPIEILYKSKPINQYEAIVEAPEVTAENVDSYHKFQGLINHCNNNAETLNSQLRDFLLTVKELKQSHEEIMAMDFMGLRDVFSDFLKKYSDLKNEKLFDTNAKVKEITSTFHRYISDRNIYTHGGLKLRFPDEIFVIQYIENKRVIVRAELSNEILKSNLDVSNQLMKIITTVNNLYNNVKTLL
ncbi:MAG: hypothetical protein ACHQF4_09365 [Sphingobacteriales bacterium]